MANGTHKSPWPATLVALAFIALVAIILLTTLPDSGDVDGFLKIWAGVGTLVGVVTGAIPAFFFKNEADSANARAMSAETRANDNEVEAQRALAAYREQEKAKDELGKRLESVQQERDESQRNLDEASRHLDRLTSTVGAMARAADGGRDRPHEQDLMSIHEEIDKIAARIGS